MAEGQKNEKELQNELQELLEEIEAFKREKERVRAIVGRIGGIPSFNSRLANIIFTILVIVSLVASIFVEDKLRYAVIDLAIGIISFKIIYIVHQLMRANHFELWILSSIEWRITEIHRELKKLSKSKPDP